MAKSLGLQEMKRWPTACENIINNQHLESFKSYKTEISKLDIPSFLNIKLGLQNKK